MLQRVRWKTAESQAGTSKSKLKKVVGSQPDIRQYPKNF